jgi:copper homeostasis protein
MPDRLSRNGSIQDGHPRPAVTLEMCVDSLDLALAAARGGADRIELCGPLHGGGITPSAGLAAAARAMIDLPLAMLVRARTGPFTATAAEFEVMRRDVLYAREIGMDLVALGILTEERTVDVLRTRQLVELAHPMQVTFHRAFDATADQQHALADVIETGAARILTSGASTTALQGAFAVARLQQAAQSRIALLLCGGIGVSNVRQAVAISQVREVHAALRNSLGSHASAASLLPEELESFAAAVAKLKQRMRAAAEPARPLGTVASS